MEIVITWSWFAFLAGVLSTFVGLIIIMVVVALRQLAKQKKRAEQNWDSVDKLFQTWGGRDNNK